MDKTTLIPIDITLDTQLVLGHHGTLSIFNPDRLSPLGEHDQDLIDIMVEDGKTDEEVAARRLYLQLRGGKVFTIQQLLNKRAVTTAFPRDRGWGTDIELRDADGSLILMTAYQYIRREGSRGSGISRQFEQSCFITLDEWLNDNGLRLQR
jgi:hypothetical protein